MKPVYCPLFLKLLLLALLLCHSSTYAQSREERVAIREQLKLIYDRDQKTRKGIDSAAFMHFIDSTNLLQVESLLTKYGWMASSLIGENGNNAIFLVIQHADLETQLKYFPLLEKSVQAGESMASHLALMQDRILMRQNKKQVYGSQVVFNKTTGAQEFYPIEDEINVNERRYKIGMQPIEDYAKLFGIEYTAPKK
jgi:hypothetical protein